MNLLCPNCQKMLTVPEQFAGQLMKCPLCAGTFTVPGLPAAPTAPAPPPAPTAPPPAPAVKAPPAPVVKAPPAPADLAPVEVVETYGLKQEPAAPPTSKPLEVAPLPPSSISPGPDLPGLPAESASAPPAGPSMGYTRSHSFTLNTKVLQYIPAAAVVLIFILQFFPWVGVYPGGVAAAWQGAWGAAFNSYGEEPDMKDLFHFYTEDELKKRNEGKDDEEKTKDNRPGVSLLMIFYFLPFFILTLVVTVGVLIWAVVPLKLPAAVQNLIAVRWGIVAALNLVTFLFLALQLLLGFSLENTLKDRYEDEEARREKRLKKMGENAPKATPKLEKEAMKGFFLQGLHRTFWLKLAVFLHLVAIIAAFLMYSIEKRGTRPPPRLTLET